MMQDENPYVVNSERDEAVAIEAPDSRFDYDRYAKEALFLPGLFILLNAIAGIILDVFLLLPAVQNDDSQQFLFVMGAFVLYNLLIVFGATEMLRRRSYTFALIACIMTVIPLSTCIIGLPLGIWGFNLMLKPGVNTAFSRTL